MSVVYWHNFERMQNMRDEALCRELQKHVSGIYNGVEGSYHGLAKGAMDVIRLTALGFVSQVDGVDTLRSVAMNVQPRLGQIAIERGSAILGILESAAECIGGPTTVQQ